MDKSFKARLATLEALEAAQQPERPAFVCLHQVDFDALDDPATPADQAAAIADAYRLAPDQKWYVGICMCDPGESCRVCNDQPVSV